MHYIYCILNIDIYKNNVYTYIYSFKVIHSDHSEGTNL